MTRHARQVAQAFVTLALLILLLGVFLLALKWALSREDFRLSTHQGAVIILPHPGGTYVTCSMGPEHLRSRLTASVNGLALPVSWSPDVPGEMATYLPQLETGLHFVRYRAEYMGGRLREAAVPVAVGPFASESAWMEHAVALTLPQSLLWDEDPGAQTVSRALRPVIEDLVAGELEKPGSEIAKYVDSVKVDDLRMLALSDELFVFVKLLVNEDSTIAAGGPLRFAMDANRELKIAGGPYEVDVDLKGTLLAKVQETGTTLGTVGGAAIGGLAGGFVGFVVGALVGAIAGPEMATRKAEKMVRTKVEEVITKKALPFLEQTLRFEKPVVLSDDLELGLQFRWSQAPALGTGQGIRFAFDVAPILGGSPMVKNDVPGAAFVGGSAPSLTMDETTSVAVSQDLLNQLIYAAWGTGKTDALLSTPEAIASLNKKLEERLIISITEIQLALPPVLKAERSEVAALIRLRLTDGQRSLDASLASKAAVGFYAVNSKPELKLTPHEITVSCIDGSTLYSCYPDLLSMLSEASALRDGLSFDIGSQLDKLSNFRLSPGGKGGIVVDFSGLDLFIVPGGVGARLEPEIRYVGKGL